MIGEQFDRGDEICGAVVNVKPRQDKIALWTKKAANEAAQQSSTMRQQLLHDFLPDDACPLGAQVCLEIPSNGEAAEVVHLHGCSTEKRKETPKQESSKVEDEEDDDKVDTSDVKDDSVEEDDHNKVNELRI